MAVTTYSSNGTPSDAVGVTGDFNIDYGGKFLWGPKPSDTAWGSSAKSIVGPTGAAGPAPALPIMANTTPVWGPNCYFSGAMSATTTGPNVAFMASGTTFPNTFTPIQNTALTGLQVTNYGATGATVYFYLQNLTTGQSVFGYNNGNGIASGQVQSADYAVTTYPLLAGNTYQWQGIRGAAGNAYLQINPKYLQPSGGQSSLSFYPNAVQPSSINIAANTAAYLQPPGVSGQTAYYRSSSASYLYSIATTITGSGPAAIFTYNGTAGANHWATAPQIQLSATPTTYTYGPFTYRDFPFTPNSFYQIGIYASGAACTVTQASSVMTVGM